MASPSPAPEVLDPASAPAPARPGFLRIVVAQVSSLFGSSLTGFALGVWVYQATGSVTRFALISFFTLLPGILLAPVAGALVDRWDRRWTMILADLGSGLCSLLLAVLLWRHALQIWHIYVLMALSSTFGAPQMLAFNASIPLLVPRRQLARANGFVQLGSAAAEIGAPAVAGIVVTRIGVHGALLIDFLTCLVAVGVMLASRIPRPERSSAPAGGNAGTRKPLLAEAAAGWHYIRSRPGLLALTLTYTALNFSRGAVLVLLTPLMLAFTSVEVMGRVQSFAASGMLFGGIVMTAWGGPQRRMRGIFGALLLYSSMLVLGSLRPDAVLIAVSAFLLLSTGPFLNGLGLALWHSKVPADLQGRVMAVRVLLSWLTLPLASLVAGPLTDRLFEPLMAAGGPLAGSLGALIGSGRGRGVALFLLVLGIGTFVLLAAAWLYRPLRRLDEEIPDVEAMAEVAARS